MDFYDLIDSMRDLRIMEAKLSSKQSPKPMNNRDYKQSKSFRKQSSLKKK